MQSYFLVFFRIISIMTLLLFTTIYIMGKRPIGELPVFDFLTVITMGAVVGADIADPSIEHMPTVFAIIVLALFQYFVSNWIIKYRKFGRLVTFEPTLIMENGRFIVTNLKGIKYSIDEVLMLLREKGIFDFGEVQYAVIESNGKLTVLKKAELLPVTPKDMKLEVKTAEVPMVVIIEGALDHQSIGRLGITEEKILFMTRQKGYASISDVFLATYTEEKGLIISPYDIVVKDNINIEH